MVPDYFQAFRLATQTPYLLNKDSISFQHVFQRPTKFGPAPKKVDKPCKAALRIVRNKKGLETII